MRRLLFVLAALLSHAALAERLTQSCFSGFGGIGEVAIQASPSVNQQIRDIVELPARNPTVFDRLWGPQSTYEAYGFLMLRFSKVQDTLEIAASILADPITRGLGITEAFSNHEGLCSLDPPPTLVTITEYHNALLDHYFLSSSAEENDIIDRGGAGPGWSRTGETFHTVQPSPCGVSGAVRRFYNLGANTHFFTVEPEECGLLRRTDPGWLYEGDAFGAIRVPANASCPGKTTAVYRLYNNRWMFNDSNHRFVTRLELVEEMVVRGWVREGVAMCLDRTGSEWWQTP